MQPAARGELVQVRRDRALLAPVPVEIQTGAEQAQGLWLLLSSPTPTNSLARSASSHSSTTGQASADRSTGSSDSTLAVSRIVARSTNTWPSRGPRTASATASAHRSLSSPTSSVSRTATCTSAADRTPMSLNSRSKPAAPTARRASNGSRPVTSAVTLTAAPIEHVAERGDAEISRRGPREHTGLGPTHLPPNHLAGHPAHEQVEDAGEVATGFVAGHPPPQIAVKGDRVEEGLEPVVRGSSRPRAPRVGSGEREGLVGGASRFVL